MQQACSLTGGPGGASTPRVAKAVAIAKDAGFEVCKEDWLRYQAKQTFELSDGELEGVAGGKVSQVGDNSCKCSHMIEDGFVCAEHP
jgi:hypothetical protein